MPVLFYIKGLHAKRHHDKIKRLLHIWLLRQIYFILSTVLSYHVDLRFVKCYFVSSYQTEKERVRNNEKRGGMAARTRAARSG